MTKIQRLEKEIEELTSSELAAFRKWSWEYDAAVWDEQIEQDAIAGKLDRLAENALADRSNCH
ncbi:MAG TPA: hypothetical protein PKH24_13175 [Sedimentisphaerales bacterium]|jgi:hypothetical protein|nr:hypothetical protein [Sedimentisphaerales bacterium]HNU29717.1 hypothetical protein [Sedimentisphaerales bacterium]